jgi:acyl-CoA synthetase (AMP-forming)/AMP-acid ligase II
LVFNNAYTSEGETLKHCLDISTSQMILSTPDLAEHVIVPITHCSISLSSFPNLPLPKAPIYFIGPQDLRSVHGNVAAAAASLRDFAALVYTSGTTGKPKACAIRNQHTLVVSNPLSTDVNNPKTYFPLRTYSALPLFHGTCLFTGLCYSLGTASTFCLARKFSSSRFFKDVHDSRATRILYVGELCRYLLATPPSPYDKTHQCIVANGNGLRGDIWEKFKERFGIPEIREFYRSTEGLAKYDNFGFGALRAGKIGFSGPIRRYLEKDTFIIRMDPATGAPHRDPRTGLCRKAKLGQPGEAIGRVKDRALLTEYLNNNAATEEKLLRDVFVKGDLYHRMGDLLMQDVSGWVHFHDRVGDTFRWKGENVSTSEVRDHIAKLAGVQDVVIYGVKLAR